MLDRTTVWYIYECPPISELEGAISVEEHVTLLADRGTDAGAIASFVLLFEAAVEAVADLTVWEGDGVWVVAALPDVEHGQMRMMFLVTPETQNLTFIASTTELPWLAAYERRAGTSFQPGQRREQASPHVKRIREVRRHALERRPSVN